jgi:MinD-like ATPase involved in chromosome partitioning or flagellar assembly
MMLVAVASLKGAPGVSRLAMSLAALWPGEEGAILVECDAVGGTLGVRYRLAASPSITSLAASTFRDAAPTAIDDHVQRLPGGLPIVPAPADPAGVHAAVADLAVPDGYFEVIGGRSTRTVIADCGRLDPLSLSPVVGSADVTVLALRPTPEVIGLAHSALERLRVLQKQVVLVTRGAGYDADKLSRTLGVPARSVPEAPVGGLLGRTRQAAYARSVMQLGRQLRQLGVESAAVAT